MHKRDIVAIKEKKAKEKATKDKNVGDSIVAIEEKKAKEKAIKDKNVGDSIMDWNNKDQIKYILVSLGIDNVVG